MGFLIDRSTVPGIVWGVLADVERWPEWTASIRSIELLDGEPLHLGSRARIRQPRLPAAVWEVTQLEPERSFTWKTSRPGLATVAGHRIEPRGEGGSTVTLTITMRGPAVPLVRLLMSGLDPALRRHGGERPPRPQHRPLAPAPRARELRPLWEKSLAGRGRPL